MTDVQVIRTALSSTGYSSLLVSQILTLCDEYESALAVVSEAKVEIGKAASAYLSLLDERDAALAALEDANKRLRRIHRAAPADTEWEWGVQHNAGSRTIWISDTEADARDGLPADCVVVRRACGPWEVVDD